ncbi:DUF1850 domain-containing protein [Pseudazoarcus pumilus]|uniref:DUF1850 domain-containing protein n=1 Tax=Pseudazoarcus pumilus TaxID=2067960 RepID=A0A2I6S570_9RHOO|nr:DUF1850 domain-containing protein [Pseudazoarcus pumilus]AUN94405.1 DUF1850 domain-containing protein [Pseudazoarcus pumilus]
MAWRLPCVLIALACASPADAGGAALEVRGADGTLAVHRPIDEGVRWCLVWNHSVAGFAVHDCFAWSGGQLVLEHSHQPDFAAGLGHIPGRGVMHSDGAGGYRIEHIDQPIAGNALRLRVGSAAVDHRIAIDGEVHSLSRTLAGRAAVMRIVEP